MRERRAMPMILNSSASSPTLRQHKSAAAAEASATAALAALAAGLRAESAAYAESREAQRHQFGLDDNRVDGGGGGGGGGGYRRAAVLAAAEHWAVTKVLPAVRLIR